MSTRIDLEEKAAAHVHGICLKTGPPRKVGVELEWLVRDVRDPALPVSADRIAAAVSGFRTASGFHTVSGLHVVSGADAVSGVDPDPGPDETRMSLIRPRTLAPRCPRPRSPSPVVRDARRASVGCRPDD